MATKKSKRSTGKQRARKPVQPGGAAPAEGAVARTAPAPAKTNREKRHDERERARQAAAQRKAEQKKRQQRTNAAIIAVAVALVAGLAFWIWSEANKPVVEPKAMTQEFGLLVGEKSAAQQVVIYEDFLCPSCGQLEGMVKPQVDAAVTSGAVSVEYRPFNQLNTDYSANTAQALWAVLEADGPEVARKFHDVLYENQPVELGEHPDEEWIVDRAVEAGATEAAVKKALKEDTYEGLVEGATSAAQRKRFSGTPAVFINGSPASGTTLQDIASQVNSVLSAAAPSAGPGTGPSTGPSAAPSVAPSK